MRLSLVAGLFPVLLWTCLAEEASTNQTFQSPMEVLASLPQCAQPCLLNAVTESACSPEDMQCICATTSIEAKASTCMLSSCPLIDSLSTKNITAKACHYPIRDKSGQYAAVSISLGTITVFLVLVRVIFKQFFSASRELGMDDKVILGTLALRISCTVLNVQGLAAHGLGTDVWTLRPHELTTFVEFLYIMEVLYLAELSLIKLSLSLFYLYIFPGNMMRRLLWGTVIVNFLYGFTNVIAAIFQCTPVDHYWRQYVEDSKGHCNNINAFGWANAAISVAIDLWMISLPLSQIAKLKLHKAKKIGVCVMFLLGAFVTVVSILRLQSIVSWANSTNPTWDQWNIVYWSTIEVNVGMICTCLPTLRLILLRAFPQILGSTAKSTAAGSNVEGHTERSKALSGRDHRMSDFDVGKGHTWTRIGKVPGTSDSMESGLCGTNNASEQNLNHSAYRHS